MPLPLAAYIGTKPRVRRRRGSGPRRFRACSSPNSRAAPPRPAQGSRPSRPGRGSAPTFPEAQAEPDDNATPARSRAISAVAASSPGTAKHRVFGRRGAPPEHHGVGRARQHARLQPRPARPPSRAASVARPLAAIRAASPMPTRPGRFSVPQRRRFSCPPPRRRRPRGRRRGRAPGRRRPSGRRTCGPRASAHRARSGRNPARSCRPPARRRCGRAPGRARGPAPRSRRAAAPRRSRCWPRGPRSARSRRAGRRAGRRGPRRSIRPAPSTGIVSTAPGPKRWPAETQGCSVAPISRRVGAGRPWRRSAPDSTAFAASVPPLVNTTRAGAAPTRLASASRAASTAARACRPSAWIEEGLPGSSSARATAADTSGRTGEVALWSR